MDLSWTCRRPAVAPALRRGPGVRSNNFAATGDVARSLETDLNPHGADVGAGSARPVPAC
jgi:hypothetical protein